MKKGSLSAPFHFSHGAFATLIGTFGASPGDVYPRSGTKTVFFIRRRPS